MTNVFATTTRRWVKNAAISQWVRLITQASRQVLIVSPSSKSPLLGRPATHKYLLNISLGNLLDLIANFCLSCCFTLDVSLTFCRHRVYECELKSGVKGNQNNKSLHSQRKTLSKKMLNNSWHWRATVPFFSGFVKTSLSSLYIWPLSFTFSS